MFTKAIKLSNAFYGPADAVNHVRYPPGSPLFQYFFMTFSHFSECALYFANGLIFLAAISVMVDLAERKTWLLILSFISSFLLMSTFFGTSFISIINDPISGVLFSVGLVLASFHKGKPHQVLAVLLPILLVLPLIKETV